MDFDDEYLYLFLRSGVGDNLLSKREGLPESGMAPFWGSLTTNCSRGFLGTHYNCAY